MTLALAHTGVTLALAHTGVKRKAFPVSQYPPHLHMDCPGIELWLPHGQAGS